MTDLVLALSGMSVLVVILAFSGPRRLAHAELARWARSQLPVLIAGAAVTVVVGAVLAIRPAAGAWLVLVALAAAVIAYFVALPRG